MRSVSLAAASAALRTKPQEHIEITGRLDGTVKASWHGNLQALQVRSDAVITAQAPAAKRVPANSRAVSLDGAVHLGYEGDSEVVSLQQTYLHTPHTLLTLEGTLGKQCSLGMQAWSDDLREVDQLALAVRESADAHD